jgi:MFS family permease
MTTQIIVDRLETRARGARAWYTVAVLTLVYLVAYVDRSMLSLLVQPIQADLHISDTAFGLLQGFAFVILYGVLGYPIGKLADSRSRRTIIGVCLFGWSLMTFASGLATRFAWLLLARIGVGIGEAGLNPCAYSMIADLFPRERLGRALAVYGIGAMIGSSAAFACGGLLIQWLQSHGDASVWMFGAVRPWQMAFFLVSVPGFLLVPVILLVPERRVAGGGAGNSVRDLLRFLADSRAALGLLTGATGLLLVVFYAFLSWTPTMLTRVHSFSTAKAGLALGVVLGSFGLAGYLSGGWLCDRWVARGRTDAHMRIGFIASWGLAPFGLLATLPHRNWLVLIGLAGLFFLANLPSAAAAAGLQLITPSRFRAQVTALFVLFVNLIGSGFGSLLVGYLTDRVFADKAQIHFSLATVAVMVGACVVLAYRLAMRPFAQRLELSRRGA